MLIVTIPWWMWLCWLPVRITYRLSIWTLCVVAQLTWRAAALAVRVARHRLRPAPR